MDWLEIAVETASEGVEPVLGRLMGLGVTGASIEDGAELAAFIEDNRTAWDYVDEAVLALESAPTRVLFYLPADEEGRAALGAIRASLAALSEEAAGAYGALSVTVRNVREEDWAENWKQYYKPIKVGSRLVVVPEWEEYTPAPGEVPLLMDPGMAFGTGTHESTRLCLGFLDGLVKPGDVMLDIGTGSGILAVAAVLLGASHADGVDIDPLAVKIAGENAALNGIADKTRFTKGDLAAGFAGPYNIVAANIVADVILRLMPDVPERLALGGAFLMSGIIGERRDEVAAALPAYGLRVEGIREENGWAAILARRT